MKHTLSKLIISICLTFMPAFVVVGNAYAATSCGTNTAPKQQVLQGVNEASSGNGCDDSGVLKVISAAVNILSLVVGIIAIIAIVNSGLKYITSGGDSGKVANAKNSLIYSLIGVIIAALAQFFVHFVLYNVYHAVK